MAVLEQVRMQPRSDGSPGEYSIGDLAALYGVSQRTLRFYDEKELLRPRRRGGQRLFSDKDRIRLEIIMLAKRLGFSLADIWALIQSRETEPTDRCGPPPSVESLGLTKEQMFCRMAHLAAERERVQRAIDELREAASRGDVVPLRSPDAQGDGSWAGEKQPAGPRVGPAGR